MLRSLVRFLVSALLATLLLVTMPQARAVDSCCTILGIHGNVVSARNKTTGKTFTFNVNDKAQLAKLKVGQGFTSQERNAWVRSNSNPKKVGVPNDVPKRGIQLGSPETKGVDHPNDNEPPKTKEIDIPTGNATKTPSPDPGKYSSTHAGPSATPRPKKK